MSRFRSIFKTGTVNTQWEYLYMQDYKELSVGTLGMCYYRHHQSMVEAIGGHMSPVIDFYRFHLSVKIGC